MQIADAVTLLQLSGTVLGGGGFILSGIAKLRDPSGTPETFRALGAPRLLDRHWVHVAYPWLELALGVAVIAAPAPLWWTAGVVMLLLYAALTSVVARVVRRQDAVECNCFGRVESVTTRTLARNIIFLGVSVGVIISSPLAAAPLWSVGAHDPGAVLAVVGTAVLAVLLTVFSYGAGSSVPRGAETFEDEILPIPDLALWGTDGAVQALPEIVRDGPVLLVHVKEGCSSCHTVVERFEDGELIAGRVRLRFVERVGEIPSSQTVSRLWDVGGEATRTLGMIVSPSAILLAANGTIPANPVIGAGGIFQLVEGIEKAVRAESHPYLPDVLK